MSKLLARAKVKLQNAENDFLLIGQDDAFLDETCFNLQQSIELSLKYIVEMNGQEYVQTHDIRAQLNILSRLEVEVPDKDQLRGIASTLNDWEAESRYNDDFTALIEDVIAAKQIAEDLIKYCDSLVTEIQA